MTQVTLSQDILTGITNLANQLNLSVNELLEQISQGQLTIIDSQELKNLLNFRGSILAESDPENQEQISWKEAKEAFLEKYSTLNKSNKLIDKNYGYGSWKDQIMISNDFDELLEDLAEYM